MMLFFSKQFYQDSMKFNTERTDNTKSAEIQKIFNGICKKCRLLLTAIE